jgi:hypothetical protein
VLTICAVAGLIACFESSNYSPINHRLTVILLLLFLFIQSRFKSGLLSLSTSVAKRWSLDHTSTVGALVIPSTTYENRASCLCSTKTWKSPGRPPRRPRSKAQLPAVTSSSLSCPVASLSRLSFVIATGENGWCFLSPRVLSCSVVAVHPCWGEGKDATLRSRPSLQPLVRRRQSGQGHPSQDSAL